MKRIRAFFAGLLGAFLLASPISTAGAAAAQAEAPVVMFAPFSGDQRLNMPRNSVSSWFSVPKDTTFASWGTIRLHMSYSPTLLPERASVTMYLNDHVLATRPTVEPGIQEWKWSVDFDPALLRLGEYNELKIASVQRSIEGDCADIDNPSNWAIVHGDSAVYLRPELPVDPELREYYNLFYDAFTDRTALAVDFALADPRDGGQVSAMLRVANAAGMQFPDRGTVDVGLTDAPGARNTVLIAGAELPEGWRRWVGLPRRTLAPAEGCVSLRAADGDAGFHRLLLQGDAAGLSKAAAFLGNRALVDQALERGIALTSDVPPGKPRADVAWNESGMYPFSRFGYDNIRLSDVFHQRSDLTFRQPDGRRGVAGSYIDVRFRHSVQLLPDRSQLSVSINGVPAHSIKLTPSNAQAGTLRVDIPESALHDPVLRVTLEVYHDLGKVDCSKEFADVAWTVIDAEESKLYLHVDRSAVRASLSGFPYFNPGGEAVAVFAPGVPAQDVLPVLPLFAARVGQNTGANFLWEVRDEAAGKSDADMLILARSEEPALPAEIAGLLAVAPSQGGYVIRDDVPVIPETLRGKLVLQTVRSPWNAQKRVYVALFEDASGLNALAELLRDRDDLEALKGQLALVGAGGYVQSIATEARPEDAAAVMAPADYVKVAEARAGIPWWAIALLLVVNVVGVIAIVRLVRRRNDEYRDAGNRHREQQGFVPEETNEGDAPPAEEGDGHDDAAGSAS